MQSALPRRLRGLFLALTLVGGAPAAAQSGLAPDGQPGFGEPADLHELADLMRASRPAEQAWLAALEALAGEVRLQVAAATESYRARGYFELVGGGRSADLATLLRAFEQAQADPQPTLARGGGPARALAGMLLDPRFRVRALVMADLAVEAREVTAGLAVLRGAAVSHVTLTLDEARAITRRVDVSASRLRAMRSDLLALRSSPSAERAPLKNDPRVTALIAAAKASDEAARRVALADTLGAAQERTELMYSALFSARLEPRVRSHLQWRERSLDVAARQLAEARLYLPGTPESEEAPPEITALKKHERIRWAGYSARIGLASDPLDDELAFISARAADYQWGSLESRALYDRFLFLRGIQHFDHRTLKDRRLDEWETEALDQVQRQQEFERPRPPATPGRDQ